MSHLPHETLERCRVCDSTTLEVILSLGDQALTGMFPSSPEEDVPSGPLELVFCPECKLSQLGHRYDSAQLYGPHYGYRSGLNGSMVQHLRSKVARLEKQACLEAGDWVLDIGSNDGTTLGAYSAKGLNRVGIDPTASKFREYYQPGIHVVPEFFAAEHFNGVEGSRPAKIITSLAMFYDLEAPLEFAREVKSVLAEDGLWHFEQSYLPMMLNSNSLDTICHEHVSYYCLTAVEQILERTGMKLVDIGFNDINGGSFTLTATHAESKLEANHALLNWVRDTERSLGLHRSEPLFEFAERIKTQVAILVDLLERLRAGGATVLGYGASTKGNVLLQYAGIGTEHVKAIAEINPDKFGCCTPGTHIPIVSDEEARAMNPDYFFVLPWHFRNDILRRETEYQRAGGRFLFPLPVPEVV